MAMVNRRKRRKLSEPKTLEGAWDRGEPPPEWACEPGPHNQEVMELYLLGTIDGPAPQQHPHYGAWAHAAQESAP